MLLALFVWLQARVEHPLLPLRVLADRNRAASQLSIVLASASMFGAFLFLTLLFGRGVPQVTPGPEPVPAMH